MSIAHRLQGVCVRPAEWPGDEASAGALMRNYAAYLAGGPNGTAHIDASGVLNELTLLRDIYTGPDAVLLLACSGSRMAGCVAVKQVHDRPGACELKRLWTEPEFRGQGVGRLLTEAAIAWARAQGASALLLDTQPAAMPQAAALYRSLGFMEIERYNDNPVADLLFMELSLR